MITKADVADLQPGDVVELRDDAWGDQVVMRGPVDADKHWLCLGPFILRRGESPSDVPTRSLTVVSRAPRPLYVNHPRTSPVPGDVVRDADSEHALALFIFAPTEEGEPWWLDTIADWISPAEMREKRLRLLVDGSTGEVVP